MPMFKKLWRPRTVMNFIWFCATIFAVHADNLAAIYIVVVADVLFEILLEIRYMLAKLLDEHKIPVSSYDLEEDQSGR
jgi:hypothetical protein